MRLMTCTPCTVTDGLCVWFVRFVRWSAPIAVARFAPECTFIALGDRRLLDVARLTPPPCGSTGVEYAARVRMIGP